MFILVKSTSFPIISLEVIFSTETLAEAGEIFNRRCSSVDHKHTTKHDPLLGGREGEAATQKRIGDYEDENEVEEVEDKNQKEEQLDKG